MKNSLFILLLTLAFYTCKENYQEQNRDITMTYPETKQVDTITDYFGTPVKDPYRWLEDDRSTETENWVTSQNEATFGYLNNIPYRKALKERLSKLWNYENNTILATCFRHWKLVTIRLNT